MDLFIAGFLVGAVVTVAAIYAIVRWALSGPADDMAPPPYDPWKGSR